ncbi:LysR family transcriptional regulator [Glaciibacter sp. 2TAF33]|uniref:LysR family transcriptional regulator n=1 Tax=Glaciibacter sp. 2TAF33 TaxID=3233015 RepID=UPI003F90B0E0
MSTYDLGMLRVFVLIYETGSVTATADRLFVSQPSVSYTLRKLRTHFNDPLFQRRGQRLEPTPVAEDLHPQLRGLLESMDDVMSRTSAFRPETSTRRFRLRMTDVGVSGLLPRIFHRIRSEAPQVSLDIESLNLDTVVQNLRSGSTDAAVCTTRLDSPDLLREPLFTQEYVGLCAADHPRIGEAPSVAEYLAEEHITVATSTGHTALDQRVRDLGLRRTIALTVPTFSALPNLLAGTDLLSHAPTSVAHRLIATGELREFLLPFTVPITEIALYTIRRELPSAEFDWFRRAVVLAVS